MVNLGHLLFYKQFLPEEGFMNVNADFYSIFQPRVPVDTYIIFNLQRENLYSELNQNMNKITKEKTKRNTPREKKILMKIEYSDSIIAINRIVVY